MWTEATQHMLVTATVPRGIICTVAVNHVLIESVCSATDSSVPWLTRRAIQSFHSRLLAPDFSDCILLNLPSLLRLRRLLILGPRGGGRLGNLAMQSSVLDIIAGNK